MLKEGIFVSLVASSRCEFHKDVKKKTIKTLLQDETHAKSAG